MRCKNCTYEGVFGCKLSSVSPTTQMSRYGSASFFTCLDSVHCNLHSWLLHGCTIPDLTSICCQNIQRKGNISFQCPLLSKRETFAQKPLEIFLHVSLPWFGLQASSRNNLINKRIPKTDLFQFLIQTVVLGMLPLESSSLTLTLARTLTFIEV